MGGAKPLDSLPAPVLLGTVRGSYEGVSSGLSPTLGGGVLLTSFMESIR